MGKGSAIVWTDNTMNFWVGCQKLPDRRACDHCYAASMAKRAGWDVWGSNKPRRITAAANWKQPLKWDREARETGKRTKVFCMSLGDFLEDRPDLVEPRKRACDIIERTTSLDWLILTKRIDNAGALPWAPGKFPPHVRMGVTIENQEAADLDVPRLLALGCKTFVSVEPMLGPVDLSAYMWPTHWCWDARYRTPQEAHAAGAMAQRRRQALVWAGSVFLEWVICGAESGPGKTLGRPLDLAWARALRDQCDAAKVPFMYKQGPVDGKLVELPELDGRVWDQMPEVANG